MLMLVRPDWRATTTLFMLSGISPFMTTLWNAGEFGVAVTVTELVPLGTSASYTVGLEGLMVAVTDGGIPSASTATPLKVASVLTASSLSSTRTVTLPILLLGKPA